MNDIDELRRQESAAYSRARQAQIKAREATRALDAALTAQYLEELSLCGIAVGDKVVAIAERWGDYDEMRTVCGLIGVEVKYSDATPILSKLKKDGV